MTQLIHLGKGGYIGSHSELMVECICALDTNDTSFINPLRTLCPFYASDPFCVSAVCCGTYHMVRHAPFTFAFFKEDLTLPLIPIRKALGGNSQWPNLHHVVIGLGSMVGCSHQEHQFGV